MNRKGGQGRKGLLGIKGLAGNRTSARAHNPRPVSRLRGQGLSRPTTTQNLEVLARKLTKLWLFKKFDL